MSCSGEVVPRPLAHALHATRPNEVVHCDYLYMGEGIENDKYILILRDDFSSYVWLYRTNAETGEAAAEALAMWVGVFGCMDWLVTDQCTHFSNVVLGDLTREFHISHHFTTAYSPWANGTVERAGREVLLGNARALERVEALSERLAKHHRMRAERSKPIPYEEARSTEGR